MADSNVIEGLTVVSFGSNTPDRAESVARAMAWLLESGRFEASLASDVFRTRPLSGHGPDYANAIMAGHTALGCDELQALCKAYELACGRDEAARASGRVPVDVDVVSYEGRCLRPSELSRHYFTEALRRAVSRVR